MPARPVKPPHRRHYLSRINEGTRRGHKNTVIDLTVDVEADIAAINQGRAIRRGDLYTVNGRRYHVEMSGTAIPVDGPGLHPMERGAYRALQVYNTRGLTDEAEFKLDREKIDPAAREEAKRIWRLGR